MNGRSHYVQAEQLLDKAHALPTGHPAAAQLTAEATAHAILARAADDPGRRIDHAWCEVCDGSGYAPCAPEVAA